MYAGHVNSPYTLLSAGITNVATTVPVLETTDFDTLPMPYVIGTGSDAETVLVTNRSTASGAGNLTVTRGWNTTGTYGAAKAWLAGTVISRRYTEYDHATFKANIEDHETWKISKAIVDAKGDLIVGTAADTVARHAIGTDLYPLVAKSGVTNGMAWEQLTEGGIALADVTTLDASTTKHGFAPKATAPAAGIINLLGIANGETAYTCKALLDDTNPEALGTAGPGTATVAARRDHIHTMPTLDGVAAPTDVTTLNVSASAHGLCPKFPDNTTTFFRGDGTYAAPPQGGVLSWSEVTGTTQSCAVNTGYILNHATTMIVATLPSTAALGDVIRIVGKGAGMWKLEQNASQYIRFAGLTTTTGTGGYLQAETAYDCIEIMCTTANNGWTVISSIGNIEVV